MRRRDARQAALIAALAAWGGVSPAVGQQTLTVGATARYRTISEAVHAARAGDRILIGPGTYREPTIVIDRPVSLIGDGRPTLDGEGQRQIMTVTADDVTLRGLRFAHVGTSYVEDRAEVKVIGARRCTITDNQVDDAFFAIYLANVVGCRIEGNVVRGMAHDETGSGNGIHLWSSRGVTITDNRISGQRDGIYFEFVHEADVRGNVSEDNLRYGLHFMYSDDCRYVGNTFRRNGAGVAVMYTHRVIMTGNRFEDNWGAAAYGLLLKEIYDSRVDHNVFRHNTTALFADGANRLIADRNDFLYNGWALRLDANTQDGRFTRNGSVPWGRR